MIAEQDEAAQIIAALGLQQHPEGGWFAETYRAPPTADGRVVSTAIYFLLRDGERSHWHRIRSADEVWHHYAGAPLRLEVARDGVRDAIVSHTMGSHVLAGERPQVTVPRDHWMTARSLGAWTLVGCTVAPAFDFADFELAPPDWSPR